MRLTHRDVDDTRVAVVEVDGEVDLDTGPALREHIVGTGGAEQPVVVDLTAVEFFDSTGLRVLDEARERVESAGGRLALAGVGPQIRRLFEITSLDVRFAMYANVDDAVAGVATAGVDNVS